MENPQIVALILLFLSTIFELMGTLTVVYSYFRTSKVVEKLIDNPDQFDMFKEKRRFNALAKDLGKKWYLTLGLTFYIIGSILGFIGGFIGIYF